MKLELDTLSTQEQEDKSRQNILDKARELYLEFGLKRTSMDDVAKRAGMGRATLYRRYADKSQLFMAVISRDVQTNLNAIEQAIQESENYLEGLLDAFVLGIRLIDDNPLLTRLLQTEPDDILPFLTKDFEGILVFSRTYIAERIVKGQKRGDIRKVDAKLTAELMIRLIQSLMLTPNGVIKAGSETSVRKVCDQFLRPLLEP